ncbi:MAG: 23S rRNA (pseudouridine(1915)-N(3))-methyltransferase RlmH [Thermovirgaceae bacterium]|nr:23S rRNA (pseudouridine(1915)-N(3))-methyltransferase RlmH [Thermovirgaceae bacterium]
MKLLILSVGKPRNPLFKSQVEEYYGRVSSAITCEWQIVPEGSGKKPTGISLAEDGTGLLRKLNHRDYFVLLDDAGDTMTSVGFSGWLFEKLGSVPGRLVLAVGGPFGVTPLVRERADMKISLSAMTLPHEMCLLILFEQIYRAITIERGGRYHH